MYGRITLFEKDYSECTLDWQRHNDQWIVMTEGKLEDCIKETEKESFFSCKYNL